MRLTKKRIALAVSTCFYLAAGGAFAQSNTTGAIYGEASSAAAGASVVVENAATGVKRTVAADANGKFLIPSLVPGTYNVSLVKNGNVVDKQEGLLVNTSQSTLVAFGGTQTVKVVGKRQTIDVTSSNSAASFSAVTLAELPIRNTVDAIVQLAPDTSRADSRYSGGASFAGGAPSENAYYINGFPVTNPLTQLGASQLPFGAIRDMQVQTGGFGAEFGRSIGGVVNINTKSGTNQWEGGVMASIKPNSTRAKAKDLRFPVTGDPANWATDGTLRRDRQHIKQDESTLGAYLGGPLIERKLFLFAAFQQDKTKFEGTRLDNYAPEAQSVANWGYRKADDETLRHVIKLDWNVTDNHHLEFTNIGDNSTRTDDFYGYNYATGAIGATLNSSGHYKNAENVTPDGADTNILKYTGNLRDDLTLTVLHGRNKVKHENTFAGYDVYDPASALYWTEVNPGATPPGFTINNAQPLKGLFIKGKGAQDEVKSTRVDIEWVINNEHTLRAGLDDNKLESTNAGDIYAGGGRWRYRKTTAQTLTSAGVVVPIRQGAPAGSLQSQGYYVLASVFNDLTNAYSNQSAWYVEDRWKVHKDVNLTLGLRSEDYENLNGLKEKFLEQKNQVAPRLGAAWDVYGDGSTKIFGSAGRYFIQIPTHIAVRGASPSLNTQQFYAYTGINPVTGVPTGLTALSVPVSPGGEFGQPKDTNILASTNLKPSYQDEFSFGFEKALAPTLNVGGRVTRRELKSTIDDWCDGDPLQKYADDNGIDTTNWPDNGACISVNPGKTNSFRVNYAGNGNYTPVTLTAADMGFPGAKRIYTAFDFFVEHPLKDKWYGKLTYTYQKSRGNTEGQTLSDIAQTDVAATQTWDNADVMKNAYGPLAGERKHQIKAYGFWTVTPEWTLGGNVAVTSGRPLSCLNNYTTAPGEGKDSPFYWYHYCNGQPSPRGALGNLPWEHRIDLNLTYKLPQVKGLAFRWDIFNVTNNQVVQTVQEDRNVSQTVSSALDRRAGGVVSYTGPRYMQFTVQYDKKF